MKSLLQLDRSSMTGLLRLPHKKELASVYGIQYNLAARI
jgi:hypothetical protein